MMQVRRRFKQTMSLSERLAAEAAQARHQAKNLPRCTERERLIRKARQAEAAIHINMWLAPSGRTTAR